MSKNNSPATSPSSAAFRGTQIDNSLPTNISTQEQLQTIVPSEFQTGDAYRPLCHTIPAPLYEDSDEKTYFYSLNPMTFSVPFILSIEFLERFSFYGVYYTLIGFLTGVYDEDWNPGLSGVDAASCVSISTAVAYTIPFLGAYLADVVLGEFWTILAGGTLLYIPGLLLICCSTVPGLLGATFNRGALAVALLVLWPMGTSFVKSCVNIFGAKQFHPLLQSTNIESYYVNFYMCINVGSLLGILIIPVVSHHVGLLTAYSIPIILVSIGMLNFMIGTPRYSQTPMGGTLQQQIASFWHHLTNPKPRRKPNQYTTKSGVVIQKKKDLIPLTTIFRIGVLIVPFCIVSDPWLYFFFIRMAHDE
jgi:proton-dependent oligopeptide transporter, POT family